MKRFSIVYLVVALIAVFSCTEEKEKVSKLGTIDYSIKATVTNSKGDAVYLEEIRDNRKSTRLNSSQTCALPIIA